MRGIVLAVTVLMTYYAPEHLATLSDNPDRAVRWLEKILEGFQAAVLFALLLPTFKGAVLGALACLLGIYEASQVAVCGAAAMGNETDPLVPLHSGLCIEQFGYLPYLALMALAIVYFWNIRHGKSGHW